MKKFLTIMATVALMLSVAACGEKDDHKSSDIVIPPAPLADKAKKIDFEQLGESKMPVFTNPGNDVNYRIHQIEFTEDSRFIVRSEEFTVSAASKATPNIITFIGKYTAQSNGVYTINMFGIASVTVSGNNVTVKTTSQSDQSVTAVVTDTQASGTSQINASRTWTVSSCILKVSGNGVSIEKAFTNGCDIYEIAKYAKDNGVKEIDPEEFKSYSVKEIIFTGANTIAADLGAEVYSGTYSLLGESCTYRFTSGKNIALFPETSTGLLQFTTQSNSVMTINNTVKGYTGSIELNLAIAK